MIQWRHSVNTQHVFLSMYALNLAAALLHKSVSEEALLFPNVHLSSFVHPDGILTSSMTDQFVTIVDISTTVISMSMLPLAMGMLLQKIKQKW